MTLPITHENLSLDTYLNYWRSQVVYYQNLILLGEQMKLDAPAIRAQASLATSPVITTPDAGTPAPQPLVRGPAATSRMRPAGGNVARLNQEANPKTRFKDLSAVDAAVICLEEAGTPLKGTELANRILAGGKATTAQSFPSNLIQQLRINPSRFVSYGEGLWGLAEWGKPA